jgi:hypothetical protein
MVQERAGQLVIRRSPPPRSSIHYLFTLVDKPGYRIQRPAITLFGY